MLVLDVEMSLKLVPALIVLPRLEEIWIRTEDWDTVYDLSRPEGHEDAALHVIEAFVGAFSAGHLTAVRWIEFGGFLCPKVNGGLRSGLCICQAILRTFPPNMLLCSAMVRSSLCVEKMDVVQQALRRGADVNAPYPQNPARSIFHEMLEMVFDVTLPVSEHQGSREQTPEPHWAEVLDYVAQHGPVDFRGRIYEDAASGALFDFHMAEGCTRIVQNLTAWILANGQSEPGQSRYVSLPPRFGLP